MLAALVTPVFLACSQGADGGTSERVGQSLAAPSAEPGSARKTHGFRADPARLLERLDKDGNGAIEASELPEGKPERLLEADRDSDGRLTSAELSAHADAKKQAHFARQDGNKDGFLSADEVGERRWSRLAAADTDKDNRVSPAELGQAMRDGKLGFGKRRHGAFDGKGPQGWLGRFDADKNGTIELSELPEHKREKFQAADADKDAKITADELKSFFEARRKARAAPPASAPVL
jgi:hypothetical protein